MLYVITVPITLAKSFHRMFKKHEDGFPAESIASNLIIMDGEMLQDCSLSECPGRYIGETVLSQLDLYSS